VHEALLRSIAHLAYHVGQMMYIGKIQRGHDWVSLSTPPGQSDTYNLKPTPWREHATLGHEEPR